ncbi:hypothetical protein AAG747_20990, partial [Rapidithrix thailandica]
KENLQELHHCSKQLHRACEEFINRTDKLHLKQIHYKTRKIEALSEEALNKQELEAAQQLMREGKKIARQNLLIVKKFVRKEN